MHEHIDNVALIPARVPVACSECALDPQCGDRFTATHYLVCPDGLAITKLCAKHIRTNLETLRGKLKQAWWQAPIYHVMHDAIMARGENAYEGVRVVLCHWTENDHQSGEDVWHSPESFAELLLRVWRANSAPTRAFHNSQVAGGYCKVKATLFFDGDASMVTRFDVSADHDTANIARHVRAIRKWQAEQKWNCATCSISLRGDVTTCPECSTPRVTS